MNDRLVWIDCEMTGLDLGADALIEVAALVTDFDLNVLGDGIDLVIKPPARGAGPDGRLRPRRCTTTSGLLDELDGGITLAEAEQQVLAYVKEHCPDGSRPPLAGNTVATDRSFLARDMPDLEAFLHYRIVDVSSIKELARRWFPRAYFSAPAKRGNHRALADIQESIEELRYYREAVFVPRPGPDSDDGQGASPRSTAARSPAAAARIAEPDTDRGTCLTSATLLLAAGTSRGRRMVGVAQLVERRVVVADVAGSSPVTHPRKVAGQRPARCPRLTRAGGIAVSARGRSYLSSRVVRVPTHHSSTSSGDQP